MTNEPQRTSSGRLLRLYMGVRWDLNFIGECIKINKIRSKLHFFLKFAIKKTLCLCCVFQCLFASRALLNESFLLRICFEKNVIYIVFCLFSDILE